MCGIVGFVTRDSNRSLHSEELGRQMLSQLAHRGPDDGFLFTDSHILLGTRRLAIVNLEGGRQPAWSEDQNIVAVFNGEIYNWPEIKIELTQKGYKIRDGSDVEIIPHAYQEWGLDFASHFNGDFAIAIWDRAKRELILARDRIGIKPLYYAWAKNGDLVFASEMKSLFRHPEIERSLDRETLAQIFTFWTPVDGHSTFQGIKQVECGHVYRFNLNSQVPQKSLYWQVPHSKSRAKFKGTFEDAKAEFRQELKKSVALRLRADVPIGTYTSGGIDSSVINFLAFKELGHKHSQTFSVTFSDPLYDEGVYQRELSNFLGLQYNEVSCSHSDIYSNTERAVYHAESPLFRTAPIPLMLLSKLVHKNGIKVVLTGEGSDEVAWGYDIFREAKVRKFWSRQPESTARPQLFRRMYAYLPQFQDKRYFNLTLDFFKNGFLDIEDPLYSHATRIANSKGVHQYLSRSFRGQMLERPPTEALIKSLPSDYKDRSSMEKCQYLEMRTLLAGYLLSSQGDRMLSSNSVEGRFPYLDHNVIEFLATLPEHFKICGLKDKHILRETFKNDLPSSLVYRPKHAYRAPEMQAFVSDENQMLDRYLSKTLIEEAGIFDYEACSMLIKKLAQIKPDKFTTRDNLAFVQMLTTQMVFETFVKNFESSVVPTRTDILKISFDL